jgi:hypothetical protein
MYKPKFTMTDRDKKKALWVTFPDGSQYNFGDLDVTTVGKAQSAIIHAFELGFKARAMCERFIDQESLIPWDGFIEESK